MQKVLLFQWPAARLEPVRRKYDKGRACVSFVEIIALHSMGQGWAFSFFILKSGFLENKIAF
jgi:hypothetical protein